MILNIAVFMVVRDSKLEERVKGVLRKYYETFGFLFYIIFIKNTFKQNCPAHIAFKVNASGIIIL